MATYDRRAIWSSDPSLNIWKYDKYDPTLALCKDHTVVQYGNQQDLLKMAAVPAVGQPSMASPAVPSRLSMLSGVTDQSVPAGTYGGIGVGFTGKAYQDNQYGYGGGLQGTEEELLLIHATARITRDQYYWKKMSKYGDRADKNTRNFFKSQAKVYDQLADIRFEQQRQALFMSDFLAIERQLQENMFRWNRALRQLLVMPARTNIRDDLDHVIQVRDKFLTDGNGLSKSFRKLSKASATKVDTYVPTTAASLQRYRESRGEFALKYREMEAEKARMLNDNLSKLREMQILNMQESLGQIRAMQSRMAPEVLESQSRQFHQLTAAQPRTSTQWIADQRGFIQQPPSAYTYESTTMIPAATISAQDNVVDLHRLEGPTVLPIENTQYSGTLPVKIYYGDAPINATVSQGQGNWVGPTNISSGTGAFQQPQQPQQFKQAAAMPQVRYQLNAGAQEFYPHNEVKATQSGALEQQPQPSADVLSRDRDANYGRPASVTDKTKDALGISNTGPQKDVTGEPSKTHPEGTVPAADVLSRDRDSNYGRPPSFTDKLKDTLGVGATGPQKPQATSAAMEPEELNA